MAKSTIKRKRAPKSVLKLPDLEQSKSAVLNSLTSPSSQRTYDHAIREFIEWYCSEPRLAFNKTVVMGALGEVLSMHAYIGAEGLRQFRRWKLKRSPILANSSHLRIAFMWSSCPELSCRGRIGSCLPHWGIRIQNHVSYGGASCRSLKPIETASAARFREVPKSMDSSDYSLSWFVLRTALLFI